MTAGSRIVIALIVLAFLGTGLYYLAISDEEGAPPAIAPEVSEPTPQSVSEAEKTPRSNAPVAEQTLAFRVPVNATDSVDVAKAIGELKSDDWRNVVGAPFGWYPVQRLDAFYSDDAQKQALVQDPGTYLKERFGLIAAPSGDTLYVLLYGTSGKSLAPARRRGVDVMSVSLSSESGSGGGLAVELGENTFEMLKTLQARNLSRSWATLIDGMVVEVAGLEPLQNETLVIGKGFSEERLMSLRDGILGSSRMIAERFVPAGSAPEREMLLATSATIASTTVAPTTEDVVESTGSTVSQSRPVAAPAVTASGSGTKYVVEEGDSLAAISENWFGRKGKWSLIVAANPGLDPDRLSIGQVLMLPPKAEALKPVEASASTETFVVRPGDSLSRISLELYGTSAHWKLIYMANEQAIGKDPAVLTVGQRLVIPAKPSE